MNNTIGFIGLGIMGKPMAVNLIKAGNQLVVYDINRSAIIELTGLGALSANSPADLASKTSTIITMLPNGPEVIEVVTGPGGILEGAARGTTIIDMSSIAPNISQEMHRLCKQQGIAFVDAPVSGGEPKAIDGTLAVMIGCEPEEFDAVYPVLKCMASSVVRTGKVGSGNVTKLANQVIVALNIAALSEAYMLAIKAGVEPALVFEAIKGGLAGSTVMQAKTPMILNRNFKPGFAIKLHIKDLTNALDTAHQVGSPLPLTSMVMEMLQVLKIMDKENNDHSGIIEYYELLSNTEVSKTAI